MHEDPKPYILLLLSSLYHYSFQFVYKSPFSERSDNCLLQCSLVLLQLIEVMVFKVAP